MAISQLMNRIMLKEKMFRLRRHIPCHSAVLLEMSQGLVSLASQSEEEFLLLGEKLQKFSSTFKQLSRQVNLSLQKLDANRDEAVLANIRHLLDSAVTVLQVQKENMARSLQHMKPVSEGLYEVSRLRDDFQKISRLLRILGTSIKIESNRAGNQGHEFMLLGEEIDQIWSHITKDTEDLLYQAARSAHLVDSARKRITGSWKHHQALIRGAQESILSALSEVEEMVQLSSRAAQEMADRAQAISQEIGEIVCSLQFHDIARQQLEHIYEALDRAGSMLKNSSGPEAESVFPLLHDIKQSLLVQRSQLENVGREMRQAGIGIRKSLAEIAEKLEMEHKSISAFCENALGHEVRKSKISDAGHSSKVQHLESEISRLASILNQCKDLEEEIAQALKPTIQSAAQVEAYMKEMEKVGYTINLLSLNALIKAAQNRESGQTFEVLAEEIHRQAALSCELSEKARQRLATLTESNQALETTLGLLGEQKSKADSLIHRTLEDASNLASLNKELSELVCVLRQKNGQLASDMIAIAGDIRFDDLFQTEITQGLEYLERTLNEIQEFLQDSHYDAERSEVEGSELLADHYTMEEERKIHQQAILGMSRQESVPAAAGGEPASPATDGDTSKTAIATIGLEKNEMKEEPAALTEEEQKDSFGDNVELF